MAKKPARVKPKGFLPRNPLRERREAAGLEGKVIADLPQDDLLELTSTWLAHGMEGVQREYGLTDGEAMALAKNPGWVALITVACNAQRAGAVHRMLQTIHRVMDAIDNKLAAGDVTLEGLQDTLDGLSKQIALLGGLHQNVNVNVSQQTSVMANEFNQASTKQQNPMETLGSDELGKLQALQRQLTALTHAGVDLGAKPA